MDSDIETREYRVKNNCRNIFGTTTPILILTFTINKVHHNVS